MLMVPPRRVLSRQRAVLYLALGIVSVLYWFLLGSKTARYQVSPWGGIGFSRHDNAVTKNTNGNKERESKLKQQFRKEYEKLGR